MSISNAVVRQARFEGLSSKKKGDRTSFRNLAITVAVILCLAVPAASLAAGQDHQVDASGNELADTRTEAVIAREVDLGSGIERFDTRVLPGESAKLEYDQPRASRSVAVVGRVWIDPDFHYRNVFATLSAAYEGEPARAEMREALRRIADSAYLLSEIRRELSAQ